MAKKEKVTLTPEEIEAKKARKKEKRIIFGKTFERAIVWLLAVVLVYSVTYISLNNKGVAAVSATPAQGGSQMPAAARPNPIGIQAQTAAVLRSPALRAAPRVIMPPAEMRRQPRQAWTQHRPQQLRM